jgi:hypothetical protein
MKIWHSFMSSSSSECSCCACCSRNRTSFLVSHRFAVARPLDIPDEATDLQFFHSVIVVRSDIEGGNETSGSEINPAKSTSRPFRPNL